MKDKAKKQKFFLADEEAIQKKIADLGTGQFFKPKEGKNVIRILPPWSEERVWYKEATLHYLGGDKVKAYPCLKMYDDDCPICNKRDELLAGSSEDQKLADQLRPRTKYYANILDYKSGKVSIWGFSPKTLGILLSYCTDPDYGDISHPEKGFDVIIDREGTGRTDTKYSVRCRPKATAIEIEGWENQIFNLDEEVIDKVKPEEIEAAVEERFGDAEPVVKKKKKIDDDDEKSERDDD